MELLKKRYCIGMELPTREKELLTLTPFLSYYDPPRPSVVSADTSSYGIRATFFQEIDGNLNEFSHTLNSAERKYAQIESF